jgi:hypothetical protein
MRILFLAVFLSFFTFLFAMEDTDITTAHSSLSLPKKLIIENKTSAALDGHNLTIKLNKEDGSTVFQEIYSLDDISKQHHRYITEIDMGSMLEGPHINSSRLIPRLNLITTLTKPGKTPIENNFTEESFYIYCFLGLYIEISSEEVAIFPFSSPKALQRSSMWWASAPTAYSLSVE